MIYPIFRTGVGVMAQGRDGSDPCAMTLTKIPLRRVRFGALPVASGYVPISIARIGAIAERGCKKKQHRRWCDLFSITHVGVSTQKWDGSISIIGGVMWSESHRSGYRTWVYVAMLKSHD